MALFSSITHAVMRCSLCCNIICPFMCNSFNYYHELAPAGTENASFCGLFMSYSGTASSVEHFDVDMLSCCCILHEKILEIFEVCGKKRLCIVCVLARACLGEGVGEHCVVPFCPNRVLEGTSQHANTSPHLM